MHWHGQGQEAGGSAATPYTGSMQGYTLLHSFDSHLTRLHEVARGAGGNIVLAKDELFRYAAAKRHSHLVLQVRAAARSTL